MKNVLVIGGSVFTGRVFSIQSSKNGGFDLHVVNRGNYPMELEHVTTYKCNRHSPRMIARLVPDITYDALVDFCAYEPGEIKSVIDALGGRIKQYIFFSTASVYVPTQGFIDENTPIVSSPDASALRASSSKVTASSASVSNASVMTFDNDMTDDYVQNKIKLENELIEACEKAGIKYTILRPTFIYGPFNYAPRESYFIERIARKRPVPVPIDAQSRFNFVYVLDIAAALMTCIGDKRAYDNVFNLAGAETLTYPQLISDFERYNSGPFETLGVTVAQAEEEQIPLPFPLSDDVLVDGKKFAEAFEFEYTPFSEGMERTFKVFYSLYTT